MECRESFHLGIHYCTRPDPVAFSTMVSRQKQGVCYQLFCLVGAGADFSTVVQMQSALGDGETLLWRRQKNQAVFALFLFGLLLKNILCFGVAYWLLVSLCEFGLECLFYAFPLCTFVCLGVLVVSNIHWMQKKWILKRIFGMENQCFFHGMSQPGRRGEVCLDASTESKQYDSRKTFPVTVLHYQEDSTLRIKMAFFHLPCEKQWHQALGCDVIDELRMEPPTRFVVHKQISILVAFCYGVKAKEDVEDFIEFLEKSNFFIHFRTHSTTIVAIREEANSKRKNCLANIHRADSAVSSILEEEATPWMTMQSDTFYEQASNGTLSISISRQV